MSSLQKKSNGAVCKKSNGAATKSAGAGCGCGPASCGAACWPKIKANISGYSAPMEWMNVGEIVLNYVNVPLGVSPVDIVNRVWGYNFGLLGEFAFCSYKYVSPVDATIAGSYFGPGGVDKHFDRMSIYAGPFGLLGHLWNIADGEGDTGGESVWTTQQIGSTPSVYPNYNALGICTCFEDTLYESIYSGGIKLFPDLGQATISMADDAQRKCVREYQQLPGCELPELIVGPLCVSSSQSWPPSGGYSLNTWTIDPNNSCRRLYWTSNDVATSADCSGVDPNSPDPFAGDWGACAKRCQKISEVTWDGSAWGSVSVVSQTCVLASAASDSGWVKYTSDPPSCVYRRTIVVDGDCCNDGDCAIATPDAPTDPPDDCATCDCTFDVGPTCSTASFDISVTGTGEGDGTDTVNNNGDNTWSWDGASGSADTTNAFIACGTDPDDGITPRWFVQIEVVVDGNTYVYLFMADCAECPPSSGWTYRADLSTPSPSATSPAITLA